MKVIIDRHHLYKTTRTDFVVADQQTYQKARGLLLEFLLSGNAGYDDIHVFKEPFVDWFDDIPELVAPVTPSSLITTKYPGQSIANRLSDNDIYSLGLLELPFVPTEKNIFRHFLGIELPQDNITFHQIYALSQCMLSNKELWDQNYLKTLWQFTLTSLFNPETPFLNELLAPLVNFNTEHAEILSEGIYCSKNSLYLERWLHEHNRYFHDLGISLTTLEQNLKTNYSIEQPNTRLEKNIYRFVVQEATDHDFNTVLTSGYYSAEADALIFLKQPLLLEDYQLLIEKFAGRLTYAQQQGLFQLCRPFYVAPPVNDTQNVREQTEAWQKWAIESFIPYKFYYDEINDPADNILENIQRGSLAYSDWLFTNYRSVITNNQILTNFDVPTMIRAQLEDANTRVVWLILDGFPAYYTPALRGILQKTGLNKIDLEWSMATLPTVTSLGIPLMLSGGYETGLSAELLQNRQAILQNIFSGKTSSYTSKLSDFKRVLSLENDLCCLHTHEVDDLLHQHDSMFDISRAAKVEEILERRISMISDMIKETADKKVKLIISTDHGATKCLKKGQNIINKRLEDVMKDTLRERCVPLTGSLKTEQFDAEDMYLLKKEVSQNREDWAIAKGYKYFGRYDSGYRHGGLSPEETIVPILCCEIQPVAQAQLQIRYTGIRDLKFGKTEREFKLKVRNVGTTAVELQEFTILEDKNCIFTMPVTIGPGADKPLHSAIKLPQKLQSNAKGGKLDLNLEVTCLILGVRVVQSLKCTVTTEKDDFEDDFDF
ncbi:PglZ domain-containing protein [Mucilaginibacter myungsuensis]|uniref:PglZ domain-containing protein n=1 Tax=Mucilaginibacter myungsuensis TaxID=649104 RepID=A0A929PY70_9SPHI|nr:PglZ domain-containing protein [Mucilaginibacter myungsuensis]MBE9663022.1 PglZ domain-containing protein [Mucilaginibacter myungsuensis]MDN3598652.1 PglZ domain-containing protein [Mucilaginibacter myungsuensis]